MFYGSLVINQILINKKYKCKITMVIDNRYLSFHLAAESDKNYGCYSAKETDLHADFSSNPLLFIFFDATPATFLAACPKSILQISSQIVW